LIFKAGEQEEQDKATAAAKARRNNIFPVDEWVNCFALFIQNYQLSDSKHVWKLYNREAQYGRAKGKQLWT
jgi:hypothetical protein